MVSLSLVSLSGKIVPSVCLQMFGGCPATAGAHSRSTAAGQDFTFCAGEAV